MKKKVLLWAMPAAAMLALAMGVDAVGQLPKLPAHLTGTIDDYTPSTVKGGPYEMHGTWSLDLYRHGDSVTADFYADLDMETSDYGAQNSNVKPPAFNVDPTNPTTRGSHTHHIRLTTMDVQPTPSGCPTSLLVPPPTAAPPVTTTGFQFSDVVSVITGNGVQAPFEPLPPAKPTSNLAVCVTGGENVGYSNVTLMFGTPASNHFGTYAIHGVVRKVEPVREEREHPW
jgi:hypothetical protein